MAESLKKQIKKMVDIKRGDLFYTSWGYDQTNYDFVVVKKLSPTKKTAICQMAKYEGLGSCGQSNIQRPKPKGFGEIFRMKVELPTSKEWVKEVQLRGSYPYVQGSRRRDTFWKHKKGGVYYETDPQFGH
jgi:hypothetical protein